MPRKRWELMPEANVQIAHNHYGIPQISDVQKKQLLDWAESLEPKKKRKKRKKKKIVKKKTKFDMLID